MYDLMIEPEDEDTEWCWEEVEGRYEQSASFREGVLFARQSRGHSVD